VRGAIRIVMMAGLGMSVAARAAPAVALPADEAPADWRLLLEDAGLELAAPDAPVAVEIVAHGAHWTVVAQPAGRPARRSDVAAPRTSDDRVAIAWLAASLLDEVVSTPRAPLRPARPSPREPESPSPREPQADPPPGPSRDRAPDPVVAEPSFERPLVVAGPSAALEPEEPGAEDDPPLVDLGPPPPASDADRPRGVGDAGPRRRRRLRPVVGGTLGVAGRGGAAAEARGEIGVGVRAPSGVHLIGTLATSGPARPTSAPSARGTVQPELGVRLGARLGRRWQPGFDALLGATLHRYREGGDVVARGWVPWVGGRLALGRVVAGALTAGLEARVVRELREVRVVGGDRASPVSTIRGIGGLFLVWAPSSERR